MTTTTSLSSSLDVLSLTSSSRWASDSLSDEDEIVWSLSSSALLSTSPPLQSPLSETADFVLVPRATAAAAPSSSASPTADTIADELASLSLTPARGNADPPSQGSTTAKKARRTARQQQVAATGGQRAPTTTTAPPAAPRRKSKKGTKRSRGSSSHGSTSSASSTGAAASSLPSRIKSAGKCPAKKAPTKRGGATSSATGLGARAVVDDSVSETSEASTPSSPAPNTTGYQEAQKYMTSYLAHPPPPGNNGSALLMLQALILELGCLPSVAAGKFAIPQLPATLRQAKLLLKSHAFINVRDYLAVREQGQDALQRVMHPNRTSLVKEVRKGKRMPVGDVKRAGLNVLLVNTHF